MEKDQETLRVLIADDEPAVRSLLGSILRERGDCDFELACDGAEALEKLSRWRPDVLITDLKMPKLDGEQLARRALELHPDLTIMVETGFPSIEGAVRLMKDGVFDFIPKPFSIDVLEERLDRALAHSRRRRVDKQVGAIVSSLMNALGRKDPYLREHGYRVSRMCTILAQDLDLSHEQVEAVSWMGLVHDVGKIGIAETILRKSGRLTQAEFDEIRKHPRFSAEIIQPLIPLTGWLRSFAGVLHHHERVDGRGYPDGLRGHEIPLESRIIAVCDTYDAMASFRPYQDSLPELVVRENLLQASGTQLDEEIIAVFLQNLDGYRNYVSICA